MISTWISLRLFGDSYTFDHWIGPTVGVPCHVDTAAIDRVGVRSDPSHLEVNRWVVGGKRGEEVRKAASDFQTKLLCLSVKVR